MEDNSDDSDDDFFGRGSVVFNEEVVCFCILISFLGYILKVILFIGVVWRYDIIFWEKNNIWVGFGGEKIWFFLLCLRFLCWFLVIYVIILLIWLWYLILKRYVCYFGVNWWFMMIGFGMVVKFCVIWNFLICVCYDICVLCFKFGKYS